MDNILRAGFIREVKYPEWLANVVVVPKKGNKWRLCVDYTDLKEACPKDNFPLPCIDQIVDALVENEMLSSLDTFSRYHQIPMHSPDTEKTTFITSHGLYYYNVMPFGLNNVGRPIRVGDQDISTIDGQDHESLHRRYAYKIQRMPRSHETPVRNL